MPVVLWNTARETSRGHLTFDDDIIYRLIKLHGLPLQLLDDISIPGPSSGTVLYVRATRPARVSENVVIGQHRSLLI
jgi:hypothetical protein